MQRKETLRSCSCHEASRSTPSPHIRRRYSVCDDNRSLSSWAMLDTSLSYVDLNETNAGSTDPCATAGVDSHSSFSVAEKTRRRRPRQSKRPSNGDSTSATATTASSSTTAGTGSSSLRNLFIVEDGSRSSLVHRRRRLSMDSHSSDSQHSERDDCLAQLYRDYAPPSLPTVDEP